MPETLLNGHLTPEEAGKVEDLAAELTQAASAINLACHAFNKNWSAFAEQCGLYDATRKYNELVDEANRLCKERRILTIGGAPYEFEHCELEEPTIEWTNQDDLALEGLAQAAEETVCLDGDSLAEFRGEKVEAA